MTEQEWLTSENPAAMLAWLRGDSMDAFVATGGVDLTLPRKLRLFACACCRAVFDGAVCGRCRGSGNSSVGQGPGCSFCGGTGKIGGLTDPRSRRAVEAAERYADGEATEVELRDAGASAQLAMYQYGSPFEMELALRCAERVERLTENAGLPRWFSVSTKFAPQQTALLRDIFGNPFRLVTLCGSCVDGRRFDAPCADCGLIRCLNDGAAVKVARSIYDDRRFADLPVLTDALEEAGCTSVPLLMHLRGLIFGGSCLNGASLVGEPKAYHRPKAPLEHVRGCWALDLILGKE